jgi:hypothetical protein
MSFKLAIKIVRANSYSENGHKKMNKVRSPLENIHRRRSQLVIEVAQGNLGVACA